MSKIKAYNTSSMDGTRHTSHPMPQPTQKIHAFLAQAGLASRRKAEALVAAGKVMVNGQRAHVGQRIDPTQDRVKVTTHGSVPATPTDQKHLYFLVNKPQGTISTTQDELQRRNVLTLIPDISQRLYPVGRLDKDSEGLMLLTNDGELTYRITHPKFGLTKIYSVLVRGLPTPKAIDFLRRGVKLKEGFTQPAEVTITKQVPEGTWLEIQIHEGKYHQVRRMLKRAGYQTIRLIRTQLGPFTLKDLHGKKFQKISGDDDRLRQLRQAVQVPKGSEMPKQPVA